MDDTATEGTNEEKPLLTIAEAHRKLRISRTELYLLMNKPPSDPLHLNSVYIGRRRLIPAADLDSLIKKLRAQRTTDGR